MDAVILFSHGSLLCGAGEALKVQAERLRARNIAPIVEVGYLNYSEPPFADAVASVVAQGATRILVTPYFLIPGKFVKVDLPRAVFEAQSAHPDVTFLVAEAIGFDPRLADALLDSAAQSFGPDPVARRPGKRHAALPPQRGMSPVRHAALPAASGDKGLRGRRRVAARRKPADRTGGTSADAN